MHHHRCAFVFRHFENGFRIMKERNEDRMRLDSQRTQAAQYFAENYSREKRYLIIFARDFAGFLNSSDYLHKKKTEEQYYFDFLCAFDNLREKMKEFSWSSDFLLENGIDFKAIRKLYFAVA